MVGLDYLIVGLFGLLVGVAELVSRYRDAPRKALLTPPAFLYAGLNAAASLLALALIHAFDWGFGVDPSSPNGVWWTRVLVAGLGAMAFFRSSLFMVRVGDTDVGVGPGGLLQIVLDATDRAVDRARAEPRALSVSRIMQGVVFEKAFEALPAFCFALMQNVSAEEQQQFARQIDALASSQMDDRVKALNLGLALMNVVGEPVLQAAVETLGDDIKEA